VERVAQHMPDGKADQGSGYNICPGAHLSHMAQPQVYSRAASVDGLFHRAKGSTVRPWRRSSGSDFSLAFERFI